MRLLYGWFILILVQHCLGSKRDDTAASPSSLDANLRKALLKALTELENEEKENAESDDDDEQIETYNKIFEKASASQVSFYTNSNRQSTEIPTTTSTEKSIVVLQKTKNFQHKPIITVEHPDTDPYNETEQILTSASNSFTSQDKYTFQPNLNSVRKNIKPKSKKLETTTVTTTTSTEESEAKVEDVQFFSAPLVAAFTVHQDERGLPKSVVPIYKPRPTAPKVQPVKESEIKIEPSLQEKQKALEEEISRLKQLQLQQSYLLKQQQFFNQQQFQEQRNNNFKTNLPKKEDVKPKENTLFSFQPSITLSTTPRSEPLPLNAQKLPIKNAVNFHSPLVPSQTSTFNHFRPIPLIPIQTSPLIPVQAYKPFQVHPEPPQIQLSQNFIDNNPSYPQITLVPPHNRVFRKETGVGNFLNNQYEQFQSPNRYFRSNSEATYTSLNTLQPPAVNQHLNSLLYNSGLVRGRQQEDLNIVSKVLSLNHLGQDYRFSNNRYNEHRPFFP